MTLDDISHTLCDVHDEEVDSTLVGSVAEDNDNSDELTVVLELSDDSVILFNISWPVEGCDPEINKTKQNIITISHAFNILLFIHSFSISTIFLYKGDRMNARADLHYE